MPNIMTGRYKLSTLWILGIVSLTLSSCSTHRAIRLKEKSIEEPNAYQFEEIKRSAGGEDGKWTIYSRKIKGTNFSEYKIEGAINASPKACREAFRQDILNQSTDLENKKYPTYKIVSESKDSLSTYVIHKEPFPLKNTEMSVRYIFFNNEDGSAGVRWHEAWAANQVPPSKKLSRVETFRGSWSFAPTSDNSCQAVNSVQFDPKGMPLWLVKPMVINFLKNGLENTRNETIPN